MACKGCKERREKLIAVGLASLARLRNAMLLQRRYRDKEEARRLNERTKRRVP